MWPNPVETPAPHMMFWALTTIIPEYSAKRVPWTILGVTSMHQKTLKKSFIFLSFSFCCFVVIIIERVVWACASLVVFLTHLVVFWCFCRLGREGLTILLIRVAHKLSRGQTPWQVLAHQYFCYSLSFFTAHSWFWWVEITHTVGSWDAQTAE